MAGKTVEEATEQALDQLGVAVGDAEVIVVDEPKTGLFGRVRVEARVRARVRPVGAGPAGSVPAQRQQRSAVGRPGRPGSRQGGQRSVSGGSRSGPSGSGSSTGDGDGGSSESRSSDDGAARGASNGRAAQARRRQGRAAARAVRPGAGAIAARRRHRRGVGGRLEERLGGAVRREGSAAEHRSEGDSGHGRGNDARRAG